MADLLPVESIALTVALAQVLRGDDPDSNTAAMCVLALARLTDRHDQTIEAACYQIAYPTDDPGNDDRCPKPWHSTRCYVHDSDYPPAAAHRFCSFAVARAEKVLTAVLPDLLAQAWDQGLRAEQRHQEPCLLHDTAGEDVPGWEMAECTCKYLTNPYRQEAENNE